MAVTLSDLANHIQPGMDPAKVAGSFSVAVILVDEAIKNPVKPVPESVRDFLIFEVGHELHKRKDQGAAQTAGYDGTVMVRAPKDPLITVRPIIKQYTKAGFA